MERSAALLAERLSDRPASGISGLLGPAPHSVARLRGQFRWHLMLKGPEVKRMVRAVRVALSGSHTFAGLPVTIDVDPL